MDDQLSPFEIFPGSLGPHVGGFLDYLQTHRYTPTTIRTYRRHVMALAERMASLGMAAEELNEARAESLIQNTGWQPWRKRHAGHTLNAFVRYLIDTGVTQSSRVPAPDCARGRLRQEYMDYLRSQRGLSERSIDHGWWAANRFLQFRFGDADGDLLQITAGDVVRFLQHLVSRDRPSRDKTTGTHLRNFLLFLFKTGKTKANLAPGIPRVAQRYASRLPRHLSPEQVETLLAAIPRDTPNGRRNYAMVLLLARLGLRACEVVRIGIDDIDWRAGELIVRGKGQLHDRMPLPQDVGEALADYIRQDRASASRALFVTHRAPRLAFRDGQILNAVLGDAFKKTGLAPPTPYVGSHILRHSLATSMVRRGASLTEVGDVLRHRSRQSTMIYARLDVESLRSIALPWPTAGGAK
jgi:integrase/recombinase XerD